MLEICRNRVEGLGLLRVFQRTQGPRFTKEKFLPALPEEEGLEVHREGGKSMLPPVTRVPPLLTPVVLLHI